MAMQIAMDSAVAEGAKGRIFTIREMNLPIYEEGMDIPEAARELCEAVSEAHGLIWASPLYHGTVSGAFKNAIDWLQLLWNHEPPYLTNKVVGLICAAGGSQGLQAINTMEYIVRALRGWTVPLVAPIPFASKAFDDNGHILDPKMETLLQNLGLSLIHI